VYEAAELLPLPASALFPAAASLELLPSLCRAALTRGASPDLAAALDDVTHAKLFLGGEEVAGLTVHEMVDLAARSSMSVVLPAGQGQGLALAGPVAPAVKL
jgi:hypothetical protein